METSVDRQGMVRDLIECASPPESEGEYDEYSLEFDELYGFLARAPRGVRTEAISGEGSSAPDGIDLIRKYDENGDILEFSRWDVFGHFSRAVHVQRRSDGRPELVKLFGMQEESPEFVVEYVYGDNSLLIGKRKTGSGGLVVSNFEYSYSGTGELLSVTMNFSRWEASWERFVYYLGDENEDDALVGFDRESTSKVLALVKVNSNGRRKDFVVFDEEGGPHLYRTCGLDRKGRTVSWRALQGNGELGASMERVFSGRTGLQVYLQEFLPKGPRNGMSWVYTYRWGDDGRRLFYSEVKPPIAPLTEYYYDYEDDSQGNWIMRQEWIIEADGKEVSEYAGFWLKRRLQYYQ